MNLTITLDDVDLSENEKEIIKESLNLENDEQLNQALIKITKSALMEYKKMFLEKGVPSGPDEVRQERLYFLLTYYFEDHLPTESEISSIFRLNHSKSKTLLKNTRSGYGTKIQPQIKKSISEVVKNAKSNEYDNYRMVIQSENILEELNLLINQKAPTLKKLRAVKDSAGEYNCPEDTYNFLIAELEINRENNE